MQIITSRLCIRPFDAADLPAFEKLLDIPTEIFYSLLPAARGKGYATEAAKAVTAWAFANFDIPYMIGTASVDNIPSQKVLLNCGYEFVDERSLLIHIVNEKHLFKYYRRYR